MIKTSCSYNKDRGKLAKYKQKRNKVKLVIFTPIFLIQYFAYSAFFGFSNQVLKLKELDQPQSAGEESLLTHDIA